MSSNEETLVDQPEPEVTVLDLHACAKNFAFLIRNKIHADELSVFVMKDMGVNAQGLADDAQLAVEQGKSMCWWLPSIDGAVGVILAPIRNVWYDKHKTTLNLPSIEGKYSVWFAQLNTTGIPVPVEMFGLVDNPWKLNSRMMITHLEPYDTDKQESESKAVQRAHQHWGVIALRCFVGQILGITEGVNEQVSS